MKYSAKQIEDLLSGVYDGTYNNRALPEDLYFAIADHLKSGAYTGFGATLEGVADRDLELLTDLRENIYMFSGAKTYQEVVAFQSMISESTSYKDFKDRVMSVYDQYNKTWLQTEYDTAIGQAQCAVKWAGFVREKDDLPNLRYSAIGDACIICKPLDGMIAPVEHAVWRRVAPLNHFGCLCLLEATRDAAEVRNIDGVVDKMSDVFVMNPGIDRYIFKEDHPYFSVPKDDQKFASENFGLPIPNKD